MPASAGNYYTYDYVFDLIHDCGDEGKSLQERIDLNDKVWTVMQQLTDRIKQAMEDAGEFDTRRVDVSMTPVESLYEQRPTGALKRGSFTLSMHQNNVHTWQLTFIRNSNGEWNLSPMAHYLFPEIKEALGTILIHETIDT